MVKKRKSGLLKKRFKQQLRYGLTAAIGFLIAYSWREPLIRFFHDLSEKLVNSSIGYEVDILTALVITFLGVLGIIAMSKWMK